MKHWLLILMVGKWSSILHKFLQVKRPKIINLDIIENFYICRSVSVKMCQNVISSSWGSKPVRCTQLLTADWWQWLSCCLTRTVVMYFLLSMEGGDHCRWQSWFPNKMEEKKERSMAKNAAFQLTAGGSAGTNHCQAQVQVKIRVLVWNLSQDL